MNNSKLFQRAHFCHQRRETRKSRFAFSKENIIRVTGIISKVKIKAIKSSPMVVPEKECGNVDIGWDRLRELFSFFTRPFEGIVLMQVSTILADSSS